MAGAGSVVAVLSCHTQNAQIVIRGHRFVFGLSVFHDARRVITRIVRYLAGDSRSLVPLDDAFASVHGESVADACSFIAVNADFAPNDREFSRRAHDTEHAGAEFSRRIHLLPEP